MRGAWLPHPREIGKYRSKGWVSGNGGNGKPANNFEIATQRDQTCDQNETKTSEGTPLTRQKICFSQDLILYAKGFPKQCKPQFGNFGSRTQFSKQMHKKGIPNLIKNNAEQLWKLMPTGRQKRVRKHRFFNFFAKRWLYETVGFTNGIHSILRIEGPQMRE